MSHATVMVIGNDVDALLQPYHEYECTGMLDEHVVFVDHHDELLEEWETSKEKMWMEVATGEKFNTYDNRFYRDFTAEEIEKHGPVKHMGSGCGGGISWYSKDWEDGRGYRAKVRLSEPPEGYQEVEVGLSEKYSSLKAYAEDYHDYVEENGRFGRFTNPNSKWDWWVIGGRWSGILKLKQLPLLPDSAIFDKFGFSRSEFEMLVKMYKENDTECIDMISKYKGMEVDILQAIQEYIKPVFTPGKIGEKGSLGDHFSEGPGRADQALKRDIDFDGMRDDNIKDATETWNKVYECVKDFLPLITWKEVREAVPDIDRAREVYHNQPCIQALRADNDLKWHELDGMFLDDPDGLNKYVQSRNCAAITFAVCTKDGWFEKGEMGWWGIVSDEKLPYDWSAKFTELFDAADDDDMLTVVDYHI
jgi:hypothetical protein